MSGNGNNILRRKPGFLQQSHKPLMIGVTLLILASAPFARYLLNWLKANLGLGILKLLIAVLFLCAGGAFVLLIRLWTMPPVSIVILTVLFLAGLIFSFSISAFPEERIHLMEYGALGLLACPSLRGKQKGRWKWLWGPLIFVLFIGVLDELFQWLLPSRVGDLRDVFFNSLGGVWGIVLYMGAIGGRKREE